MPSASSPNTVTLPPFVPVAFMVFCRLPDGLLPTTEQLKNIARAWISGNVPSPLRELTTTFLDQGIITMTAAPVQTLPTEMYHSMVEYLTAAQKTSLDRSTHVLIMRGQDMPVAPRAGLWTALAAAIGCAANFGAELVIDADTQSVVTPGVPFSDYQVDYVPRAKYFVRCPFSRQPDGYSYMTTLGLGRYGVPELQILDIPIINVDHLGWCLSGVSQVVAGMVLGAAARATPVSQLQFPLETELTARDIETAYARIPETGPDASVRLRLELKPGRYGQPQNYITLSPPEGYEGDYASWLHAFVAAFFHPEQTMQARPIDDRSMEAARAQAVSALPGVKARYQSGQIAADRLGVKYAFPTPDGVGEVMWIFVRSWTGDRITGELVNAPQAATDVRLGQSVTIREADIFDWITTAPDGTQEGGFTDAVLRAGASAGNLTGPRQSAEEINEEILPEYVKRRADAGYVARVTAAAREDAQRQAQSRTGALDRIRRRRIIKPLALGVAALALIKSVPYISAILGVLFVWQLVSTLRRLRGIKHLAENPANLAAGGELRSAMVIMANTRLYTPGESDAPALVIVLPNDESDPILIYDAVATGRTALRQGVGASHAALKAAEKFLTDEGYIPNARLLLPADLTNGAEVYAAHLAIERSCLRDGVLNEVFVPVLFVPGEKGAIGMISYKALDAVR